MKWLGIFYKIIGMNRSNSKILSITKDAEDFGIDTNLLRYNLSLSYEERMKQHAEALKLFSSLRKKSIIQNVRSKQNTESSC